MEFLNDLGNVGIGLLLLVLILSVGAWVFSRLTRFDDQKEIAKGNEAAGIYMGSKLLGLCIIVAMVSYSSSDWLDMVAWAGIGILVLCLVYFLVDKFLPYFNVCEEIEKGNVAVAQLLRAIILGISVVVGTMLM